MHILLACDGTSAVRERCWKGLEDVCPAPLIQSMQLMNDKQLMIFILNACYHDYNNEWKNIFDNLSDFISNILCDYYTKVYNVEEIGN